MLKKSLQSEIDENKRGQVSGIQFKGPIRTLQTPVRTLRVTRLPDMLQCDITFTSGLPVENTQLVRKMFSLQPEAFKLYHFVRIWIHIGE